MDAIKYLKENDRMCKTFDSCSGKDGGEMCELYVKSNEKGLSCADYATTYPEEAVKIIEKWAKEHPRKTRQSEFLKMFPRAGRGEDGLIVFCPEDFDSKFECLLKRGGGHDQRGDCRREYWLEEVEDDASEKDPTK